MNLVLLGTSGYHPNDRRHTACLMIPEHGIVLDAGTGMYRVRDRLATRELRIFLTHAHLDHVVGLTFLLDVVHEKKIDRVLVYGQAAKLAAVAEHLFAEPIFPVTPFWEFCPLDVAIPLPGGGLLAHFPLDHPGGATGFRLDWPGHSMAYVTDTLAAADAPYLEHIRGVDLLVHECYFPDSHAELAKLTGHSHTTPVASLARAASVGRLILVHINPLDTSNDPVGLSTARSIFPRTELGEDLMTLEF